MTDTTDEITVDNFEDYQSHLDKIGAEHEKKMDLMRRKVNLGILISSAIILGSAIGGNFLLRKYNPRNFPETSQCYQLKTDLETLTKFPSGISPESKKQLESVIENEQSVFREEGCSDKLSEAKEKHNRIDNYTAVGGGIGGLILLATTFFYYKLIGKYSLEFERKLKSVRFIPKKETFDSFYEEANSFLGEKPKYLN